MTTYNTHPENNDADAVVVEHSVVSDTTVAYTPPDSVETQAAEVNQASQEAQQSAASNNEQHIPFMDGVNTDTPHEQENLLVGEIIAEDIPTLTLEVTASETTSFVEESEVRPFTDFIAEFRQSESRPLYSSSAEEMALPDLAPAWDVLSEPFAAFEEVQPSGNTGTTTQGSSETVAAPVEVSEVAEAASLDTFPVADVPVVSPPESPTHVERPVSPLLRPASRIRLPRHGMGRQREERVVEASAVEASAPVTEPASTVEEHPRPARRYRFDRPLTKQGPPSGRDEEHKETLGRPAPNGQIPSAAATVSPSPEVQTLVTEQEPPKAPQIVSQEENTGSTPTPTKVPEHDRRRHHGQERQYDKDQVSSHAAPATLPTPIAEVASQPPTLSVVEPAAQQEEVKSEDLPPLEYADLQAATSRRRRRRRGNGTAAAPLPVATPANKPTDLAMPTPMPSVSPAVTPARVPGGTTVGQGPSTIISGHTVSQMNQSWDGPGPFMGPEPSAARGSTISREVRPVRAEVQRAPAYPPRPAEGGASSSIHHLTNVIAQAIHAQTDRMVSELRRANQAPTNISVSFPPFPSNERVGVFVDVANLLYSARTLRMTVDFGKLLDFLRGNRRLVRAHAYCPTSPQPGDEQMFLQAVKGLGYRITTKNYKTFSSGAKKADLDLDLCMDVVRLVDGRAVDCVVLVSGDSDFMPMLDYCSDHGVRVEVAAFDEAMSATLRQSCDLFINLSMLEEIRA